MSPERNLHAQGEKAALLLPRSLDLEHGSSKDPSLLQAFLHEVGPWSQNKNWERMGAGTELLICFSFVFLPFSKFSSTPTAG